MDLLYIFTILLNVFLYTIKVDGQCTLPTLFDGTWWDSRKGSVTIIRSSGKLTGWSVTAYSVLMTDFTCVSTDTSYWLFKSDLTTFILGSDYHVYYCIKYTKITDYSYYYYLDSNIESEVDYVRVSLRVQGDTEAVSELCNPTTGPSSTEFHVLVAENRQTDVKQWFPDSLLGVYAYTVTDKSNSVTCGANTVWDACTNRTTMSLNYTQCGTQLFGSSGGELYATKYVSSGSTDFVILINGDSTTSTRFTCLVVSGITVVSNPGSCAIGQNTSYHTGDANSLKISLSAYETCPFTTDSDSPGSSNIAIIAAAVAIVIILIAVGVVIVILYYKRLLPCQKTRVSNISTDPEKPPPPSPGTAVEPISPRVAVDINTTDVNRNTALPPLPKPPVPPADITATNPLPSITRH